MQVQYVYKLPIKSTIPVVERADCGFYFLRTLEGGGKSFGLLVNAFGLVGGIKAVVKLGMGRRFLYIVESGGRAVNTGWVSVGFCKFYEIESEAVVIGPVYTPEECRGHGYATFGLSQAVAALLREKIPEIYIDTATDNFGMQKVIERCGFGAPVKEVEKAEDDGR